MNYTLLNILFLLSLIATFLLIVNGKISCLQSYNPHSTHPPTIKECPLEEDSCMVFYSKDDVLPRYGCLSKFDNISPQFMGIKCAKTTQTATCFTSKSHGYVHKIFLHRVIDLPMSLVLHNAGIEKLCCCQSNHCNYDNERIENFFLRIDDAIDDDHSHIKSPDFYVKNNSNIKSFFIPVFLLTIFLQILIFSF
uniref:TGF-beta family profile domain-containing protein n=1 Tax=Strongyloides stercoralis TaxID=6248 RepID=A0A0K0ENB7_STRER